MDELKAFLRDLADDASRDAFAQAGGTSVGHLRNVAYGLRKAAPELCVEIERHSDGRITCESLRPDMPWTRTPDKLWPGKRGRPVLDFARAA